ncbi:hypothetical protein O181_092397 [Austropuccinia psidii MF-1]|uniref:Uncharacterized protein n=1 Tax=Austropuccinia psidii MF-1 TaxID=1389203 RepID=A0A9Q3P9I3_9BASI|nr:hypothetical protein [Austropuccinia psidii MF-1]
MNHEIHASHPRYFSNYSSIFNSFHDPSFKISKRSLKNIHQHRPIKYVPMGSKIQRALRLLVECDVGQEPTFTCLAKNCHITTVNHEVKDLSNYYFEDCKSPWIAPEVAKPLHPYEFHLSTEGDQIVVTSGWRFTTNSTVEEIKHTRWCPIEGSDVNKIHAHCVACTPSKKK